MSREFAIGVTVALIAAFVLCAGCATFAPAQPTPTPAAGIMVTGTTGDTPVALTLTAKNMAFDRSRLVAPAGSTVSLVFVNDDPGVPHNFALYSDETATTTIFRGAIITGRSTTTYTFTAPSTPGTYFFRCDPHPRTMTGSFVVT